MASKILVWILQILSRVRTLNWRILNIFSGSILIFCFPYSFYSPQWGRWVVRHRLHSAWPWGNVVYSPVSVFCLTYIKTALINYQLEIQVGATTAAHRKVHKEYRSSEVMNWHFDNCRAVWTTTESPSWKFRNFWGTFWSKKVSKIVRTVSPCA